MRAVRATVVTVGAIPGAMRVLNVDVTDWEKPAALKAPTL